MSDDEVVIFAEAVGSGAAVLFLHSGVCDSRMWDYQWPDLAGDHYAIRCDLRGFGRTEPAAGPYRDADDVRDVLDALGVERVAVVGSSLGGRVALELSCLYPARIRRMVLLCPAFRFGTATPEAQNFQRTEQELLAAGDLQAVVELNVRTLLGPDARSHARKHLARMHRRALDLQTADVREGSQKEIPKLDLAGVNVPTTIISGGQDLGHFQQVAERLAATIPDATLRRLEWAGHLPNLERPQQITSQLRHLLDSSG